MVIAIRNSTTDVLRSWTLLCHFLSATVNSYLSLALLTIHTYMNKTTCVLLGHLIGDAITSQMVETKHALGVDTILFTNMWSNMPLYRPATGSVSSAPNNSTHVSTSSNQRQYQCTCVYKQEKLS